MRRASQSITPPSENASPPTRPRQASAAPADAEEAGGNAAVVDRIERHEREQRVVARPRRERGHVGVHQAVDRHVRERSGKRADQNRHHAEGFGRHQPSEAGVLKLRVPAAQDRPADRRRDHRDAERDDRGAKIRVARAVQHVPSEDHAEQRLDVHRDLHDAERQHAEVAPEEPLQREPRAHVERRERH
jgi:hypothetical protein